MGASVRLPLSTKSDNMEMMLKIKIAYSIFSLYRNTKTIHSIMMIWQNNFIESNYKLASGPPKDPGGVKNIFSRSRGH